jgi:two-component system sensor histidine kinase HydH
MSDLPPDAPPARRAAWFALRMSAAYVIGCVAYIVLSTFAASETAGSVSELRRIEWIKGTAFVLATGGLFYWYAFRTESHRLRSAHELRHQRVRLLDAGTRELTALQAAALAHDLGNVVTVLSGIVDEIADELKPSSDLRMRMIRALTTIDDITALARDISAILAHQPPQELRSLDFRTLAEEVVAAVHSHPRLAGRRVEIDAAGDLRIEASPTLLRQALLNLLLNAAHQGPTIRVELRGTEHEILCEVHDDGPGFSDEALARALEPRFTTREGGSGLGLFSVGVTARAHGGTIELDRSPLGGACVRLRLPRAPFA